MSTEERIMMRCRTTADLDALEYVATTANGHAAHRYVWHYSRDARRPVTACNMAPACIAEVGHLAERHPLCRHAACFGTEMVAI